MTRSPIFVLFASLALTVLSAPVRAQTSVGKDTLQGLKGIYVLVESVDDDVERLGLTRNQLQADAELRLRKAGIRVPPKSQSFEDDIGTLIITVSTHAESTGLHAFDVAVDVSEGVLLARSPLKRAWARTYFVTGMVGLVGAERLQDVRNIVNDKVDYFINDYLAMNPKP